MTRTMGGEALVAPLPTSSPSSVSTEEHESSSSESHSDSEERSCSARLASSASREERAAWTACESDEVDEEADCSEVAGVRAEVDWSAEELVKGLMVEERVGGLEELGVVLCDD